MGYLLRCDNSVPMVWWCGGVLSMRCYRLQVEWNTVLTWNPVIIILAEGFDFDGDIHQTSIRIYINKS